jgi:hypothetical protein
VAKVASSTFLRELRPVELRGERRSELADRLDEDTRARLERLRRGR